MNEDMTLRQIREEIEQLESAETETVQDEHDIEVSASEDEMKLYWSLKLSA